MSQKENDSFSVESGSCDCSNYNSDISWFYLSQNLKTFHFELTLLKEKKEEKKILSKDFSVDKKEENIEQKEIKVNLTNIPNKIEIPKYIKNENDNLADYFRGNIKKKFTDYRSKYKMALKNKRSLEHYLNTEKNKNEINKEESENKNDLIKVNKIEEENKINPKVNNRHFTNKVNRNRFFNINISNNENNDKKYSIEKNKDINKEREKDLEKEEDNNGDKEIKKNSTNDFGSKRRFFNYYKYAHRFKTKNNEEKDDIKENINKDIKDDVKGIIKDNNDSLKDSIQNNINKSDQKQMNNNNNNNQIRGKTINEKVVKETKNITLQPGQSIKPKIVTKRTLKPKSTIVTNEDGTQTLITEYTYLTTTTINELIDSTTNNNDNYPLDIQLVRQYITKTYITEIESTPYIPKKRFSFFK